MLDFIFAASTEITQTFPAGGELWFFWLVSGKLVIYLLLTTLSIHYFGLWLDRIHRTRNEAVKGVEKAERKEIKKRFLKQSRWVLAFAIVLHIGVLLTLKYSPFFTTNLNAVFTMLKLPLQLQVPSYLMPIGISFFTLQAVSYLIDVYRETIPADDNIFRLGLFMSFFRRSWKARSADMIKQHNSFGR